MSKIIVGISANEKPIAPDSPIIHLSVSRYFADGVKRAGALPFYIPLSNPEEAKDYVSAIDALLLTGGQDIHPSLYHQEVATQKADYFLERDLFESALLAEALKRKKPILAVCRGMQLLNSYLGGNLNQDIPNHSQGLPLGTSHEIALVGHDSKLSKLFHTGSRVNSVHHQSINRLGKGLVVTARDPRDQTIEAVELPGYPLLAVQWHPEFLIDESSANQALFDTLVQFAKEQQDLKNR